MDCDIASDGCSTGWCVWVGEPGTLHHRKHQRYLTKVAPLEVEDNLKANWDQSDMSAVRKNL